MAEKKASTSQVLGWALNHIGILIAAAGIIGSGYLGWNHFQMQWQNHVDPDCKATPNAGICKIDRLEKKVDHLQQTMDQLLLLMPRRR